MQAMRHCSRSLLQRTAAICLNGRSLPATCTVAAAAGMADAMATRGAADVTPPHSIRGYASPLHSMVYNERPHEWLLIDPLDKDAVQYVRSPLFAVGRYSCIGICTTRCHVLRRCECHKAVQ